MLDERQKEALTMALDYAKKLTTFPLSSKRQHLPVPTAPLVIVHGGAGSGKSRLISSIYNMVTDTLKKPGDNPDCPYILLTSFTGAASSNINGQTLHTTFSFKFGTTYMSMPERQRCEKRALFQNVKFLIIDEISMISADMLYNVDLRLREITGRLDTLFGGVSVWLFGDLYQLKPPKARYVFEEPSNKEHAVAHKLRDLWKMFTVINLEKNHCQGEDKIYGDLLNRVRTASHTEEDVELLRRRVCQLNRVGEEERTEKELNSSEKKSSTVEGAEEETIIDENENLDKPDEEENSTEEQSKEKSNFTENSTSRLDKDDEKEKTTSRKRKSQEVAKKDSRLDKNALHIYGTNYKVNARNKAKLEEMPGKEFTMEAKSWSRTVKTFKTNKAGCVSNTPFLKTLKLKIGCDVVLVHNLDTLDGLTNGCRGKLVDVEISGGKVHRLVVEFDNPDHGRLARMRNPCKKHPKGTYIDRINWTYMLGGATAQVCQFPLKGAAAMTGHKIQVSIEMITLVISSNSTFLYSLDVLTFNNFRARPLPSQPSWWWTP